MENPDEKLALEWSEELIMDKKRQEIDPEQEAEMKAEKAFERWFQHSTGYGFVEREDY